MKGFEKFLLVFFSIVIIIIALTFLLVSTEMIEITNIISTMKSWLINNKTVGVVIGGVFALLGLIGLFSTSDSENEKKGGLAIKGEKGTVYITKDTFENIILGVAYGYVELRNIKADILMTDEGVIANIYAMILPDTVVPTLTAKLQENIKASVLKQTTVEIKEANIKIKGVYLDSQKK